MQSGVIPTMSTPFNAGNLNGLSDLAGLHFHSPTDTLLILSHESMRLIEVTPTGTIQPGSISFTGENAMTQPEGVTVGSDGTIYVVGEPDQIAVFVTSETGIPEPSALVLMLFGLACFLKRQRR